MVRDPTNVWYDGSIRCSHYVRVNHEGILDLLTLHPYIDKDFVKQNLYSFLNLSLVLEPSVVSDLVNKLTTKASYHQRNTVNIIAMSPLSSLLMSTLRETQQHGVPNYKSVNLVLNDKDVVRIEDSVVYSEGINTYRIFLDKARERITSMVRLKASYNDPTIENNKNELVSGSINVGSGLLDRIYVSGSSSGITLSNPQLLLTNTQPPPKDKWVVQLHPEEEVSLNNQLYTLKQYKL